MTESVDVAFERHGAATIVRLAGEIDLSTAASTGTRIEESTDGVPHVVLDLGALDYMDSAGLAMVDGLARRCRQDGRRLELVVPDDSVVRTAFAVSGLDRVVVVHPTRADALRATDRSSA